MIDDEPPDRDAAPAPAPEPPPAAAADEKQTLEWLWDHWLELVT